MRVIQTQQRDGGTPPTVRSLGRCYHNMHVIGNHATGTTGSNNAHDTAPADVTLLWIAKDFHWPSNGRYESGAFWLCRQAAFWLCRQAA